jgi:hypothetical protein
MSGRFLEVEMLSVLLEIINLTVHPLLEDGVSIYNIEVSTAISMVYLNYAAVR